MMKHPLMKPEYKERAQEWLEKTQLIELPGGAAYLNGNKAHLEIEPGANRATYIRALKRATEFALTTRDYLIAIIPTENKRMIKVAEWLGFHVEREHNGNTELRKEKSWAE